MVSDEGLLAPWPNWPNQAVEDGSENLLRSFAAHLTAALWTNSMKILFGYLFLAMAAILSGIQAYLFAFYNHFDWWRSFLLASMTIGCVIGATLIFKEPKESYFRKIASGGSALICLGLISRIAYLLLTGGGYTSGWEYVVLAVYTLSFGIYAFNGFES